MENHPRSCARLTSQRELWGNPPEVLEHVRDPHALYSRLKENGFACARVLPPGVACPADGRWLMKSRRSSGGLGVRHAIAGEAPGPDIYLQEFVPGAPMSAVFVANPPHVEVIGVTEQLIGTDWLHARGFKYAGNIGPVETAPAFHSELVLLGTRLMTAFGLRGVIGVDFIAHADHAWAIEVNPRYPASVEVLEHAMGHAVLASGAASARRCSAVGKAIFYAPHRFAFPASGPWDSDLADEFDPWRLPGFADIPEPGAIVEAGWPVLTIFASGSSRSEVHDRLQSHAAELDPLFAECTP